MSGPGTRQSATTARANATIRFQSVTRRLLRLLSRKASHSRSLAQRPASRASAKAARPLATLVRKRRVGAESYREGLTRTNLAGPPLHTSHISVTRLAGIERVPVRSRRGSLAAPGGSPRVGGVVAQRFPHGLPQPYPRPPPIHPAALDALDVIGRVAFKDGEAHGFHGRPVRHQRDAAVGRLRLVGMGQAPSSGAAPRLVRPFGWYHPVLMQV